MVGPEERHLCYVSSPLTLVPYCTHLHFQSGGRAGIERLFVNEEAALIHKLNSSAVKGLRFLGYCPYEHVENAVQPKGKAGQLLQSSTKKLRKTHSPTLEAVVTGFRNFYNNIDSVLTKEEKEAKGWNVLMAEHTLCKVTRLSKFWDSL